MESDHEIYPMPAFPTLQVTDLEASTHFYVDGLGFMHIFSIPGPYGIPMVEHIRFSRYADILLEQESENEMFEDFPHGLGVRLSFSLPPAKRDCDEIAQRAHEIGARVEGPIERPWNVREVVITDPDGYTLVFTEPIDISKSIDDVISNK